MDLAQLVGTLVSTLPGVQFRRLHYRKLEIEKNLALREHKGNYEAVIPLPQAQEQKLLGGLKMLPRH